MFVYRSRPKPQPAYFQARTQTPINGSYFIYSACLVKIRKWPCVYNLEVPLQLLQIMLLIGLVNNSMSLLVFYERRYKNRHLSLLKLLRYYYIVNLSVVIFLVMDIICVLYIPGDPGKLDLKEMAKRLLSMTYQAFQKVSVGILSFITILRCVHSVYPYFVTFSPKADTLSYLVLMVITAISFTLHVRGLFHSFDLMSEEDIGYTILFYFVNVFLVVVFNIAWIVMEKKRRKELDIDRGTLSMTRKLYQFAFMSCALFVCTTLPGTIFLMIPKMSHHAVTCDACQERITIMDYLLFMMYCGCFFDNWFYILQSKQYRMDLYRNLIGVVRTVVGTEKRSEFDPSHAHSRTRSYYAQNNQDTVVDTEIRPSEFDPSRDFSSSVAKFSNRDSAVGTERMSLEFETNRANSKTKSRSIVKQRKQDKQ